ncbi:MAG: phosphatidylserine decarboxylase, partial [Hydrogenophaga sp.]|nr:phosphatidylserine decarboxylase [Hydrogenophaga sp.]
MKLQQLRDRLLLQEDLNFLLTNRIPRILLTHVMGWYSRIRSPWLTRISIRVWRLFTELDLDEARQQHFESLRDCFIRELKPGARPIDQTPEILASPCDAIVGAHGRLQDTLALQAKGMPYRLEELLGDPALAREHADFRYITLR